MLILLALILFAFGFMAGSMYEVWNSSEEYTPTGYKHDKGMDAIVRNSAIDDKQPDDAIFKPKKPRPKAMTAPIKRKKKNDRK